MSIWPEGWSLKELAHHGRATLLVAIFAVGAFSALTAGADPIVVLSVLVVLVVTFLIIDRLDRRRPIQIEAEKFDQEQRVRGNEVRELARKRASERESGGGAK